MHHRNIAYLIADSSRARIVLWSRDAGSYRTAVQIDDGLAPAARAHQPHGLDFREESRKKVRGAFAEVLAEHLRDFAARHPVEGVVLIAPARVLTPLKVELQGGPPILGTLAKDLTKHPDEALHEQLTQVEIHAPT